MLTKPKSCGGLGIRESKTTNDAFLMNQAWRIWWNPHSLLAKFLSQKHYQTTDFLQTASNTGSHSWKALLWGRNLLQGGLQWIIRNGCKINFWSDHWLSLGLICGLIHGPLLPHEYEIKVARLITTTHQWDLTPFSMVLPSTITQFIYAQPLPIHGSPNTLMDDRVWDHHASVCSVRSTYHYLLSKPKEIIGRTSVTWSWIWKLKVPPKIQMFFVEMCASSYSHQIGHFPIC